MGNGGWGGGESGLASIKEKIKFCGDELQAWGSSKSKPNKAAMKILQNWLEVLNSAEVVTEESKAEYLSVSRKFTGHNGLGSRGLNMEIRTLNISTQKPPKEEGKTILRVFNVHKEIGWIRWKI